MKKYVIDPETNEVELSLTCIRRIAEISELNAYEREIEETSYNDYDEIDLSHEEGFKEGEFIELELTFYMEGRIENDPDPQFVYTDWEVYLQKATIWLLDEEEEPVDYRIGTDTIRVLQEEIHKLYNPRRY